MITLESLATRVRDLEAQLSRVKAELRQLQATQEPEELIKEIKCPADLRGLFRGQLDLTEEEIDAAKYNLDLDEWDRKYGDKAE